MSSETAGALPLAGVRRLTGDRAADTPWPEPADAMFIQQNLGATAGRRMAAGHHGAAEWLSPFHRLKEI